MLVIPASVIATWPKPNYINPETRGPGLLITLVVLCILCLFAVTARLWARLRIVHSAGLDDVLIVVSLAATIALTVIIPLAVTDAGWDRHIWDVPVSNLVLGRKYAYLAQIFFALATSSTRISILLFYRRITAGTMRKAYLYTIYAAIIFILGYLLSIEMILLLGCRPLSAYWEAASPTYNEPYTCYNEQVLIPMASVLSTISDGFVIALPCYTVYSMRMPIRQKLSLLAIFCVGLIVCIAGIIRTVYVWGTILQTYDQTWIGYSMWLWTALESDLAILCACAPALKPFFHKYLGGSGGSSSARGNISSRNAAFGHIRSARAGMGTGSISHIKSGDRGHASVHFGTGVTVTTELTVLERAIDDTCTEDNESVERYTSSITSTQDLSRNGAKMNS